jgi:hypothetical protein
LYRAEATMNAYDITDGDDYPFDEIDARLLEAAETMPPWYDAWLNLDPESSVEERLAVYQAIRSAGTLPEAASFWLVSRLVDDIVTRDGDDDLRGYEERLDAFEAEFRLIETESRQKTTRPEAYRVLKQQYYRAWDDLLVRRLEEFGEADMARLCREDRGRFQQLCEEGMRYFFEPLALDGASSR